jgi:shikimate dehydrogenase
MTIATSVPRSPDVRVVQPAQTLLLGLIGAGIGPSRSPVMHQSEGAAHGLATLYRLIDLNEIGCGPEALPNLLTAAERFGAAGLNITFPCKQAVIPHLHELSPHAEALGAVNTVVLRNGRRIGHNTDWTGYAAAVKSGLDGAALGRVTQFGAGGAGAALAYAQMMLGVGHLHIVDTDAARANALVEQIGRRFGRERLSVAADAQAAVAQSDGVVNATPIGMATYPGTPFPVEWLTPRHWVSEIIYFPLETGLLAAARRLGCRTLDGSEMNVQQAAEAFRLFTGLEPDVMRMRQVFFRAGEGK